MQWCESSWLERLVREKLPFILTSFCVSPEDLEVFNDWLPSMLPIVHMNSYYTVLDLDLIIVYTVSSIEDYRTVSMFTADDVVVLIYACDRKDTFDKLLTTWIHMVHPWTPLFVVGCKFDLVGKDELITEEIETEIRKTKPQTSFF